MATIDETRDRGLVRILVTKPTYVVFRGLAIQRGMKLSEFTCKFLASWFRRN